jgi:serine/threonine protein kinase
MAAAFTVARFDKLRTLGTGAFGSAFHVRDRSTQKEYALKVSAVADAKIRAAALSEAAILTKLHDPNVVEIFAQWEEGATFCILLELCGGSVSDLIRGGREAGKLLSEAFILRVFSQLCAGLAYVHCQGVLHRDIKSANILWQRGEDGQLIIKLADFGISRHLGDGSVAHTFIGSPFSLSPEILNGSPYNQKSDIWSLGCVLFELCALNNPFGGKNPSLGSIVSSIFTGTHPPLHSTFSAELQSLLSSLFTLDPAQRPDIQAVLVFPIIQTSLAALQVYGPPINPYSESPWTPLEGVSEASSASADEAGWGTLPASGGTSQPPLTSASGGALPSNPAIYDTLPAAQANPFLSMAAMLRATQQKYAKK